MVIFEPYSLANTRKPSSHDSCFCVSFEHSFSSLPDRSSKHFIVVRVVAKAIEFSEMLLFKMSAVPECVSVRSSFVLQNRLVILVLLCY